MAHFAKLGANSKVIQVLTLDNKDMLNADGVEDEAVGQQYLEQHNNWPAQMWIQTSYNTSGNQHKDGGTPLRGNYAGIGYTYDSTLDAFLEPKPYPSWILDETTYTWNAPVSKPTGSLNMDQYYEWNESSNSWQLKTND